MKIQIEVMIVHVTETRLKTDLEIENYLRVLRFKCLVVLVHFFDCLLLLFSAVPCCLKNSASAFFNRSSLDEL